jgi:proline iminopeptidase
MKRTRWFVSAGALLSMTACASAHVAHREGFIPVEGGRVWYQIVGSGPNTPLLVIHGGFGINHLYLKPMAALAVDRPVIFYDQLGGGYSDRPTDTTLWRMDRWVDEIARVREALGLKEIHLFGHSLGATLAVAYMERKPKGVHSLILAGAALNPARFRMDRDSLMHTLPESVYSVILSHQQDHTTDAPEYVKANRIFLEHFHARRLPWSQDLDSAIALNNPAIGLYMGRHGGPGDWTAHLGEIGVPTLFTFGRYDYASPATMTYLQSLIPGAELVILDQSGHLMMHDEPEHYNAVLRDFLRRADAAGRKPTK